MINSRIAQRRVDFEAAKRGDAPNLCRSWRFGALCTICSADRDFSNLKIKLNISKRTSSRTWTRQ
jgi:hypothetical protein